MIFHDITQNSPDWYNIRAGKATASQFSRIITASGKPSSSAEKYAYECIAEIYMGHPIEKNFSSRDMEHGNLYEGEAISAYEMITGFKIQHGGFFTDDNQFYGASPDVRIYDGDKLVGVAEIKCPQVPTHIEYFMMGDKINPAYMQQVQGHLLVTGCDWCDWFSYHPELPPALVRTYRDENFISLLEKELHNFNALIDKGIKIMNERGFNISIKVSQNGIIE
jgi:hypothetical protein